MDIELLSLDRIPLPSLEMYAFLSIVAASSSLYYFWMESQSSFQFYEPYSIQSHENDVITISDNNNNKIANNNSSAIITASVNDTLSNYHNHNFFTWHSAIHWASQQPHCVWPLVNLAYCLLILLSHFVQKNVFGNLRASEQENIKDQFWNLVFYKVVFVFGVVNVQEVEDAVGWCFFVSVIGFLQLARQLCKDRHNYLILMNDCTRNGEIRRRRITGLLTFILFISVALFGSVCAWYFNSSVNYENGISSNDPSDQSEQNCENSSGCGYDFNLGLHSTIFMLSEIGLLVIQSFHALLVCVLDQIYSKYKQGRNLDNDHMSSRLACAINFKLDLVALLFDLIHHVHMLVCCNLFLSMTSLIVSLQMRARVRQIHNILKKHQSYIWLTDHIDKFPDYIVQLEQEKELSEDCAICWDSMYTKKSKILPCKHIFHAVCLRKWLLVSMNCPTCRLTLISDEDLQKSHRGLRRQYASTPIGVWGFLQTGQTLLDLFGGWDPEIDEIFVEEPSPPSRNVSLFGVQDFGVQDWTVQPPQSTLPESVTPETDKSD